MLWKDIRPVLTEKHKSCKENYPDFANTNMNSDSLQLNSKMTLCSTLLNERLLYHAGKSLTVNSPTSVSAYDRVGFIGLHLTWQLQMGSHNWAASPREQTTGSSHAGRKPHARWVHGQRKSQPTAKFTVQVAVYSPLKAGEVKITHEGWVIKYRLQFYQTQVQLLLVCSNILCFVQNHILIKCFHIPQNYQKK